MIDIINKSATLNNFEVLSELYEKCLSLLYNLTHKDELNVFYVGLNLQKVLVKYFNLLGNNLEVIMKIKRNIWLF